MRNRFIRYGLLAAFVLCTYFAYAFMDARTPEPKAKKYFEKRGYELIIHRTTFEDRSIKHIEVKSHHGEESPLIIFVHGTPGSSDNFFKFMADAELGQGARMISMDRLGYGGSEYGTSFTSIELQAQQIKHVAEQYEYSKLILVGHSYGGPIVARFAMDHPDIADVVFLLAPAVDPDNEKIFWFSPVGKWKATRWILPGALRVSADEKYSHEAELRKMSAFWKNIRAEVVHMHGTDDMLVPYANLDFVRKQMEGMHNFRAITLRGENHFLPWDSYDEVKKELIEMIRP